LERRGFTAYANTTLAKGKRTMTEVSKQELGVLKSIWRRNEDGKWIVHDIQGIDLKPQKGFSKDYFKIKNDIHLLTQSPAPIMDDFFSSFGETEFLLKQSIVPIVAWNDGDSEIKCIGTGFFISASGYLMTAAHVLRDPVDGQYTNLTQVDEKSFQLSKTLHMGIIIPPNPAMRNAPFTMHPAMREAKIFVHPVEYAYHWGQDVSSPLFHEKPRFEYNVDVAILKIKENVLGGGFQPLNIGMHSLKVGDQAMAIGYAKMTNIPRNKNGGIGEFQHDLFVSVGSVKSVYLNNQEEKQTSTPGPCFDFDAKIPGKMSGSPILVGSGILTKGIVSRSWQDEKHASGCLVAPVMQLKLQNDKSLLDLMNFGNEGIAKIQAEGI